MSHSEVETGIGADGTGTFVMTEKTEKTEPETGKALYVNRLEKQITLLTQAIARAWDEGNNAQRGSANPYLADTEHNPDDFDES